jgi:hypothetical protein
MALREPDARGRLAQTRWSSSRSTATRARRSRTSPLAPVLTERTFFRYFADKREVPFSDFTSIEIRLLEVIGGAAASTPPLTAVTAALEA